MLKKHKAKHLVGIILALSLLAASCDNPSQNSNSYQSHANPAPQNQYQNPPINPPSNGQQDGGLSNDNYYTNSLGNEVHSPAFETKPNVVPQGASARCGDGTYSFSQNRRGTCSHHGGVSEWLN